MEDDVDCEPTASSSRDKRASEPSDEHMSISKKLEKDQLGAVCINCPDLDDVGCTGFGKTRMGLLEMCLVICEFCHTVNVRACLNSKRNYTLMGRDVYLSQRMSETQK